MRNVLKFVLVLMMLVATNIFFAQFRWFGNSAWEAIDRFATVLGYLGSALLIYGILEIRRPVNWLTKLIKRTSDRRAFADPLTEEIQASADALVFVADKEDLCKTSLNKLKPKAVAVLYSDVNKLQLVINICNAEQIEVVAQVHVPGLDNTSAIKRAMLAPIAELVARFGIERVFVDLTGGFKPVALGLFMAAEENGVGTIYLVSEWKDGVRLELDERKRFVFISKGSLG